MTLNLRCVFHSNREAVARCPECQRFFCRECVSEHDYRVLCTACLAQALRVHRRKRWRFTAVLRPLLALMGLLFTWFFFDLIGRALTQLPASVHEGTIWSGDD